MSAVDVRFSLVTQTRCKAVVLARRVTGCPKVSLGLKFNVQPKRTEVLEGYSLKMSDA
jgi:hypothetical protein